ncbi:hypothetical protein [Vagococcus xieshaowenii]|uniref:Uncharacterized protein n=1 Tax=Vagococcus xieshaowenii TaxID=2562451 RepID=A0A4Z0D7L9_9ENTE|nr:hypothetical protein [Vagococcus xieshaowenii]QCA29156.1 hypothetical protein E4Z98_07450 [Vagococcus xieshaowenii]TFZ40867.1 hypothetical protein E4031_05645 [Vagococcus xieshaowenii]
MNGYGKILKKNENSVFHTKLLLVDDLSKTGTYPIIMNSEYKEGYTQVIINSYLMLKIAERMLIDGWTLGKVEVDDPSVDQNTRIEINNLVEKIKESPLYFSELESYLEWALDEGSIFIDKIIMGKKSEEGFLSFELTSSGLQRGKQKELVFNKYIKNVVEVFLNGR